MSILIHNLDVAKHTLTFICPAMFFISTQLHKYQQWKSKVVFLLRGALKKKGYIKSKLRKKKKI